MFRRHYPTMTKTNVLLLCLGSSTLFFFAMFMYMGNDRVRTVSHERGYTPCVSVNASLGDLRRSQIRLSRELNQAKMEYGKLNCEINKLQQKQLVTSSGGWCKADSAPSSKEHITDHDFAKYLSTFFNRKRVASFGDGPGLYKKYFDATGLLAVYDAYDGAPYCEEVTNGDVKFLDLTVPQYGIPVYDWVMSLEVAEHIPEIYEHVYIDNIVRHARDGILLSWAVPGQGGHSHINMKSLKDVMSIMNVAGFRWDEEESKIVKSKATLPWLVSNVNVFRRIVHNSHLTMYS